MTTVRAAFREMVVGLSSAFITDMTELCSDLWEGFLHRLRLHAALSVKPGFFIWWVTLVSSGSAANW